MRRTLTEDIRSASINETKEILYLWKSGPEPNYQFIIDSFSIRKVHVSAIRETVLIIVTPYYYILHFCGVALC